MMVHGEKASGSKTKAERSSSSLQSLLTKNKNGIGS